MPQTLLIQDCMRKNPFTIKRSAPLVQAIETLIEYKLTGITVVDDSGIACGVLSELDCIRAVLGAIYNDGNPGERLVEDVMTADVISCEPSDSIIEVAQGMLDSRQRRRPVIKDGKLVGQVSSANVLWALMEQTRRRG